jgi:pseudaminic acid synthase
MKKIITINENKKKYQIGGDNSVFIIAELSANHNQNFDIAVKTVKAAKEAGADAIKLQTYTPDTITINCNEKHFQIKEGLWKGKNLYQLYKEAYTPWDWQPKLKKIANDIGIVCFSSPFDKTAVDFLDKINMPAYKVASAEITDLQLIQYIASKRKPVLISTGIATMEEIQEAVNACREVGNNELILLKCTSVYPAPVEEANLRTIPDLSKRFDVISGLSDHTLGITVPVTSIALGAKVIEKHFILDKSIGGPDASFSLDKVEFKEMVVAVRTAEKALGQVNYEISERVKKSRDFSRSLFIVKDLKKGEVFSMENVRSIRPGYGLSPKHIKEIIGKKAARDLNKGTPLHWKLIN